MPEFIWRHDYSRVSAFRAQPELEGEKDERRVTWAVTLDFHNTIARCDAWFDLEVFELVPAYLDWHSRSSGLEVSADLKTTGRSCYRKLRQRVIESGTEIDAAESLEIVLKGLGIEVAPEVIDRALVDIFEPTVAGATPIDGVIDSVNCLRESGVRLAVVSSAAYHPFLEWTLAKFGIDGEFDAVLTSASTGHYKSTSRIYSTALEMLGVPPEQCIHVGDSERFDVQPARSLGIRTVLFDGIESLVSTRSEADLRIPTLAGLPDRLRDTFGLAIDN